MIEIRELTKVYGPTTAVDHLTVTVEPGRVTGFLGPNGAGKSTTMRIMVGLTPPSRGSVTIGGHRYADLPNPAREGAGFFSALFDFSFTNFVTPILVRFVYLLATVALVATWLVLLFASFLRGFGSGLSVLVLGPIFLVIYLAVIRMTLEFYLSVVRMSEDIHKRLPQA